MDLVVHKNTLEKRRRKEVRQNLINDARVMAKNSKCSENISGYAILVWDDTHISHACWQAGNLPSGLIGEHFKQTMARELGRLDAKVIMENK